MSKKRETPPKPEELIQRLGERLDTVKVELETKLEEQRVQVVWWYTCTACMTT
jgi:hypothetical protein